ncbi:MAG: hypothetical protein FWD48_11955 [Oscillospiraceae bacterium]|nr:hypothetical protein [Oscillospiraceae bacterium]
MITFNAKRDIIYVNAACLKRLPDMEYVHILISPPEKKLALRPCGANERNAIRIKSESNKKRYIRCDDFIKRIIILMGWEGNNRYKLHGKIVELNDEIIIVFNLDCAEREAVI